MLGLVYSKAGVLVGLEIRSLPLLQQVHEGHATIVTAPAWRHITTVRRGTCPSDSTLPSWRSATPGARAWVDASESEAAGTPARGSCCIALRSLRAKVV